jgi:hypothetical protein
VPLEGRLVEAVGEDVEEVLQDGQVVLLVEALGDLLVLRDIAEEKVEDL